MYGPFSSRFANTRLPSSGVSDWAVCSLAPVGLEAQA